MILPVARDLAVALMMATIIFLGFTAGADFLWQKYRFDVRMKRTKEETKEDYKLSEGDPHVKARLRQPSLTPVPR
jgi:flagellar biosynthetic protein FlhB